MISCQTTEKHSGSGSVQSVKPTFIVFLTERMSAVLGILPVLRLHIQGQHATWSVRGAMNCTMTYNVLCILCFIVYDAFVSCSLCCTLQAMGDEMINTMKLVMPKI